MNYYYPGLDILRILACYMVILIHVSAAYCYDFSSYWIIPITFDSFSRCCVPIFYMLSGFFLLDTKIYDLRKFYYNRMQRILIPYMILCIIYFFSDKYNTFNIYKYIYFIINNPVEYHIWFVYCLIGIYLCIPFFVVIIESNLGKSLINIFLLIWIISILIPQINTVFNIHINTFHIFNLNYFSGYIGYVLLGWYLKNNIKNIEKYKIYKYNYNYIFIVLYVFSSLLITICTYAWSKKIGSPNELFFANLSILLFLQSISLFIIFININYKNKIIYYMARLSFWIYLIHVIVLSKVNPIIDNIISIKLLSIPISSIAILIISTILSIPLYFIEKIIIYLIQQQKFKFILKA